MRARKRSSQHRRADRLGPLAARLAAALLAMAPAPVGAAPGEATRKSRPPDAVVLRCGQPARKQVALTFDDGPTRRFTPRVLQILARERVKAAFFVLGQAARREPALLQQIHEEGHLLAAHSFSHPRRASLDEWRDQLRRTEEAVNAAGLRLAPYLRPPHGTVTPALRMAAGERGYTILLYTLLSSDWTRPGSAPLVRQVVGTLAPGGIVVLHDGGGDRSQTVEALPEIIRGLRKKGLEPVRLDQLLGPSPRVIDRCARASDR